MTRAGSRWVARVRAVVLAVAAVLAAREAAAQVVAPRPRVVEVLGATSDAHDVAVAGGRVLVATSGGVAVVREGRVERVITARDGLPGTRCRSVSVTPEGVWVGGVEGAALVVFDAAGVATVARRVGLARVRRAVAWGGATYFATAADGVFRLAPGASEPARVELGRSASAMYTTDLAVHRGALYVATAGAGVARLDASGRVTGRLAARRGLPDNIAWDLEPDGARLLVATAGGVAAIEGARVVADARMAAASAGLAVRDARAVARARGGVWIGTFGAGAHRVEASGGVARVGGAGDAARVRALAASEDGVYVAHDAGLARVGADGAVAAVIAGALPSSDVTSLAQAFGALWVGTFDRGLARVEGGVVSAVPEALARWGIDRRVNDLASTRDAAGREALWIATDRGLYVHDGRSFVPVLDEGAPPAEQHVTALHVDAARGELWAAGSRGLARRAAGRWTSVRGEGAGRLAQLHAVTVDARGGVWAGGLHGLFRVDRDTWRVARHDVASGALPVDWVTAVVPWGDGVVAGTYHGGLVWRGGDDGFAREGERDGLPSGWVNPHAMREVGGALWVGTLGRGLMIGQRGAWRAMGTAEGLPSADVTAVVPAGERSAWVATRGGIARVAWD